MANSKFKCRGCKKYFPKDIKLRLGNGYFHSIDCATKYSHEQGKKKLEKHRKEKHKELKRKVRDNDKSHWTKKAQQEFNKYIRNRDKFLGCISCSKPFNDKYDAGHYRSTGAHPELRFNELNNHGQCVRCNQHLSGNLINYRINLSNRISEKDLAWLEGHHEPKRYTIGNLKTIVKWYKRKNRRLEDVQDNQN